MTHLWEIDHPYYANEGNYYKAGLHNQFASWDEFMTTTFFDGDRDLNLLYRWDWRKPGHHEWDGPEYLLLFFMLQRKAICCSVEIPVTEADEPRVRWFLEDCAQAMRATWEPIALGQPGEEGARLRGEIAELRQENADYEKAFGLNEGAAA
ncbi:hypothetical protein [Streptomyces lunaelactis]|uniref:hypothetical protein n=1 Tax=Streptomyces lunaelactis TaxID=1535768 RepID=UPI0015851368|nr:hypothetical protein [Streptomyces lunaelactis]NUL13259.1 hypothetical protein [Streptomyces lunaelactis]